MGDLSVLVNFVEAHNVGHAVEALRYVAGHRAACPDAHIGLVLNAATPVELAGMVDTVDEVFAVPMTGGDPAVRSALEAVPATWDHVLDNLRRDQPAHAGVVPGFARYYELSDEHFHARVGHARAGIPFGDTPGYVKHQPVRLDLPTGARDSARAELEAAGPVISVLPAGSGPRSLYPSAASWRTVLDALRERFHPVRFVLVGRHTDDERTSSSFGHDEHAALLGRDVVDAFDRPLEDQLALVEASDVFVSTHSGFGWAALAVETPWLTIAGGRWPEVFFNDVPFISVLPDRQRFGGYSLYQPPDEVTDHDGSPRSPHACMARIEDDLDRIVGGAARLVNGDLDTATAMDEHFTRLLAFLGDDRDALFAIDGAHVPYT